MAHPNEQALRKGYEAFNAGDIEGVKAVFDPNVTAHILGKSQIAGDYQGVDEVLTALGNFVELSNGTFQTEVHDVLANDSHGVVLGTGTAQREGRTWDQKTLEAYHMENGKITEFWSWIEDADADEEFWG